MVEWIFVLYLCVSVLERIASDGKTGIFRRGKKNNKKRTLVGVGVTAAVPRSYCGDH